MWALGNQQSRWSYYPQQMAEDVVARYRKDDLPLGEVIERSFLREQRDSQLSPSVSICRAVE
jgi:hypothetical protein